MGVNPRVRIALMVAGTLSLVAIVVALAGMRQSFGGETLASAGPGGRVELPAGANRFEGALKPDDLPAPDFELRNQDGKLVSMRDLRGTPVIVTFLYARCDATCPPQAQVIKGALDQLPRPVPVVAVSVDPRSDTPGAARHFLAEQGMVDRMDFVLGSQDDLEPVWKGYAIQPEIGGDEHQAVIALIDAKGRQRIGFPLGEATPSRIAHDVALLAAE